MAKTQPNILFIYSDQHRYDSVGINGHPFIQTPNMDKLAQDGANFSNAFTPIPMCVPARCSLLTGQWPTEHGVIFNFDGETFHPLDPSLPTSCAIVRDAGYSTIHIGRWHVDPKRTPLDYGFHEYIPTWKYQKWRAHQGIQPSRPEEKDRFGHVDKNATPEQTFLSWSANQVIDRMERTLDFGEPFFIRWHMAEPHLPCKPPEPYASMYRAEDIPPWPGFSDNLSGKPLVQKQMRATWGTEEMTWDDWAPVVARYFGVISLLDAQIGRVLEALDRLNIAENTIVIYSADHGDLCGSHGMIDKHMIMYDDVVRVPLMLRWPGTVPSGTVVDSFVSNAIDLAATFCDAAGVTPPETFSGESLLPLACGSRTNGREDIFATYHGNQFGAYSQRMVRDRRWKYIWNASAIDELYDLETDPGELTNRITDPSCASEVKRLRSRLLDWMEQTHDRLSNKWIRDALAQDRIVYE